MGKKINPNLFRFGKNSFYHCLWYSSKKKYFFYIKKDILLREILKKSIFFLNLNYVDIIVSNNLKLNFYLKQIDIINNIEKYLDLLILEISKIYKKNIIINFIFDFEDNSSSIALNIINNFNNKISIKKVIKKEIIKYKNYQGCKIQVCGRIDGVDIARKIWILVGKIPLHTIRSKIDYCYYELVTQFGIQCIKVWLLK